MQEDEQRHTMRGRDKGWGERKRDEQRNNK